MSTTPVCTSLKQELLAMGARYTVGSYCPICEDAHVKCKIGYHPTYNPDPSAPRTVTFKTIKGKAEKTVQMAPSAISELSLREFVREKFPEFEVAAFKLFWLWDDAKGTLTEIETDESVAFHLASHPHNLTVLIESNCKGFSKFTLEDALLYAEAKGIEPITDNDKFASSTSYKDDDETVRLILDQAFREIVVRMPVFSPLGRAKNETTVREFITPVLLAAARITGDILLECEKNIAGSKGNGPVDYAAEYKDFNVVITEAKRDNVDDGLGQNIAQIVSAREDYLRNVLGVKRKIEEAKFDIRTVPSFGAVSTADHWVFTLYEGNTVYRTNQRIVSLESFDDPDDGAALRRSLYAVIRQLVGLLEAQKKAVDANETTRTKKGRFGEGGTFASSASVSASASSASSSSQIVFAGAKEDHQSDQSEVADEAQALAR